MREESYIEDIVGDIEVDNTIILYSEDPKSHQLAYDTPTVEYVDDSPIKTVKFSARVGNVALKGNYSHVNGSGRLVRVIG